MKRSTVYACLMLLASFVTYAQRTLTGRVTAEGEVLGLPGVSIQVAGSNTSTTSDYEGNFSINLPEGNVDLIVTKDGYNAQQLSVSSTTTVLDVVLSRPTRDSQDAISVGYGTQTKEEMTGSVASVGSDNLGTTAVNNIDQANQGKASGVFVQNSSGKLGEGTNVRIRGGSSLSSSNQPLYVIDGIPLTSDNQAGSFNAATNPLADINPNDIASIEVLKDASAASIYGSRAANGVIIITTKTGDSGKMKIDADYQFGVSETPTKLELYSPQDYNRDVIEFTLRFSGFDDEVTFDNLVNWEAEAREHVAMYPDSTYYLTLSDGSQVGIPLMSEFIHNTDWQDEVFRTAFSHRFNLGLSGGGDKHQYYAGGSYTTQEGILIGNDFERINGRLNLNSQWSSKLSTNLSTSFNSSFNNRLNEDADLGSPLQAIVLPPSDTYDPDNDYKLLVRSLEYNPLTEINFSDNTAKTNRFIGNLGIGYDISRNLQFKVEGGLDYLDLREEKRQGPETLDGAPTGLSRLNDIGVTNYTFNGYFTYNNTFGDNNFNAVLGTSYQESNTTSDFRIGRVNSIEDLENIDESDEDLFLLINNSGYSFLSYFTRLNYSIQEKYVLQLSGRIDGSSKFGEENRYGVFPAASAGWNISNESFLQDNSTISFLKLKASYGLVGNTPDDPFLYRANFLRIKYGNEDAYRLSNLSNPNLKWETTAQLDVGVQYGFWNDRVSGEINYYQKNTSDLLFPVQVSPTSGFNFVLKNAAEMTNSGFEFNISTLNVDKADFTWTTDFNISTNTNEIVDLGEGDSIISGVSAFIEGQPTGVFFMRKFVGVNELTGDALYDNGNGGTTTDWESAPRMIVGDPNPELFGGLSSNLRYKSLELFFLFQFTLGNDMYFETGEFLSNSGIQLLGQSKDQVDRWYAPRDDAQTPKMLVAANNTFPSTRWLQDGSYLRLNTVTLTYHLPTEMVANMGLRYFDIYVGGQNLITFTKYTGYDPDVGYVDPTTGSIGANISRGVDYFSAPQARVFTTGIKIGL